MSALADPRCFEIHDPSGWKHGVTTFVFPFLSVIGIVGDIFMLLTIHFGRLQDSPYVYLKCVALGDLILMGFHLTTWIPHCVACHFTSEAMAHIEFYEWYFHGLIVSLVDAWLGFVTLFLTIERFVCVRWPMKARSLCTRKRAKKICAVLILVSCFFEIPLFFGAEVGVNDYELVKLGTTFRSSEFRCEPNINATDLKSPFTCYNKKYPIDMERWKTTPRCPAISDAPVQESSKERPQVYECLHTLCELPWIPENLEFNATEDEDGPLALIRTSMNASLVAVVNGSMSLDYVHRLPREELIGEALYINRSCVFVVAPLNLKPIYTGIVRSYVDTVMETVWCVGLYQRDDRLTYMKYIVTFELFCSCVQGFSTVALTVLNILIVILVRRANREAADGVLSCGEQNTALKRRIEENRLTMSLLSLSSVKIFTDLVYLTTQDAIATWVHDEVSPPGNPMRIHQTVSYTLRVAEYSTYFYLLAFFNRKFKEEFFQRVVHDNLKKSGLFGWKSPNSSEKSTNLSGEQGNTQQTASQDRNKN